MRGFIDSNKIPTFHRYPEAQIVRNTIFLTQEKLKATPGAPLVTKVSLRVYNDWDAFTTQLSINLERLSRVG